jgi:hypothetical protein
MLNDLDIGTGSGNYRAILKYNAKAGRWAYRNSDGEMEIAAPTFVMDLYNTATGWAAFREGEAPERAFDPEPGVRAARTRDDQKRCLMVLTYATEAFDGVAEMCTTSMHMLNAIKDIYGVFREKALDMDGKLPVVKCTGTEPSKDKFGTNYRPLFEIVDWVDRPAEMPDEHPAKELIGSPANDNNAPANHVSAPAATGTRPAF